MKTDNNGTIWRSVSTYVDIDTGEVIRKYTALSDKYLTVHTIKNISYNANKTRGLIEYTIKCRRNPQQQFNFS